MSDMLPTLEISENFYSVQGEGISTGVPAYFIRLKSCNLRCGLLAQEITSLTKEMKNVEEYVAGGNLIGGLQKEGKATWTCDSAPVWVKGVHKPFQYLVDDWISLDILDKVKKGLIHLIWTGGEPTIPKHQKAIFEFLNWFDPKAGGFNEIETNGTICINDDLFDRLDQINCSAKLSNSGMTVKQRINPDAIQIIKGHRNHSFKFVVSTEEDIQEAISTYIEPFDLSIKNVCMMPGLDKQEDFHERTNFILEMSKKYGIRGLQRLHISAWGSCTGV